MDRSDARAGKGIRLPRLEARPLALALVAFALLGCDDRDGADPVRVTKDFLSAVNEGDCDRAWRHYSAGTQTNIRDELRRAQRESDGPVARATPETRYCQGSYGDYKRGSARLISATASEALVTVTFSQGTRLALIPFLSTPYKEYPGELRLVKEGGQWKVERPRARIGRQGWDLVEVGDVDVFYSRRGDPSRRHVEAQAVLRAPRAALQRALVDPALWARVLPAVSDVEVVESSPPHQRVRVRVRFAGWDRRLALTAQSYGNPVDASIPWTTLQFKDGDRGPDSVLVAGSLELKPRSEGTWVMLSLVVDPRQWPADLATQLVAPERIAAAVLALEERAKGIRAKGKDADERR